MSYPDAFQRKKKSLLNPCFNLCLTSSMNYMQPYNKISSSHQMQMEIQFHHPLQIIQKQTVTEKKSQQQDQEVGVSSCMIHADFVMDMCTDHSAEGHPIFSGVSPCSGMRNYSALFRVRKCAFLVANVTKNFALATRISQLVASGRLTTLLYATIITQTIQCSFDFQPN